MIRPSDIIYSKGKYWVIKDVNECYEIYEDGITHAKRVAQIGYNGGVGLVKAHAEIQRRLKEGK